MANVFISYRGSDNHMAERLAIEIRNRGHQVWFDEWSINIGDSIISAMNQGLFASNYLILCLSNSGTLAPWMSREWMSALARQLEGKGIKVLPVRLTAGELPAILADIQYADLTEDWDAGLTALFKAIR